MPRTDYTDISIILDRSGSMQTVVDDTIGGFNHFLETQKDVPGKGTITLVQFDTEYEVVYHAISMNDASALTRDTFVPRGSTALLDAIGRTISETGARLAAMPEPERPLQVIVVILTDGEENSSKYFTSRQIADMITHQSNVYNWQFVFLGANQDAIATAASYGIARGGALTYASSKEGSREAFQTLTEKTRGFRNQRVSKSDIFFDEEDRRKQQDHIDKEGK